GADAGAAGGGSASTAGASATGGADAGAAADAGTSASGADVGAATAAGEPSAGPAATTAAAALARRLEAFGAQARSELQALFASYLVPAETEGGEPYYIDQDGFRRSVRAYCDATEIAGMFGELAPGFTREQMIAKLQSFQDPQTGLLPDPWAAPDPENTDNDPSFMPNTHSGYNILSIGYALEVLGSHVAHPIHVVERMTTESLYRKLDAQPWKTNAWGSGAWIDHYATGLYMNARYFGSQKRPDDLFGWLHTHADPTTGLWGRPTPEDSLKLPVNGFYRLTRSTYAQFNMPLPYAQTTIDTVLTHTRNRDFFRDDRGNACNVLDVIHPLWLCMKQTDYRRDEIVAWSLQQIERVLGRWQPGRGFSFELETHHKPGLQGTEMWLSILYLLADACGIAGSLGYRPQGVHRLEPALYFSGV
ncbi:acyltransferase, partial [Paenibacillus koleovorans]|uniref:acyltransferase n=1 Tax=Paenibacillus koleovorans TaxID=121608 RepID=UPI0013E29088